MKYILYIVGVGVLAALFVLGDQFWAAIDQFISFVRGFLL